MTPVNFTTSAMQAAAERAGLAHCQQADILFRVAMELEANLTQGEYVLELAETTAPGFHSLAAITNQRILIGTGPGTFQEIPLAAVSSWREIFQPTLGLELRIFDSYQVISGLGSKGRARLQHALAWVVANTQTTPHSQVVTDTTTLRSPWQQNS